MTMAEENVEETSAGEEETNGNGNGHSNGHQIGRMAAIAAASGATAYAAKKALESRSSSSSESDDEDGEGTPSKSKASKTAKSGKKSAQTSASLVGAAVSSGWDVAQSTLLPIIEDAATKAGAYAAESTPEVVRDVVIPRFISGFEKARGKKRGDDSDE
jgi:hypothetical protein